MTKHIIRPSEVLLNDTYFPVIGNPQLILASTYPQKMITGDYTKDSEQEISTWIIGDQRGGMLCEEMVEKTDGDRSFFSTCDTRFKGHLFLPPLATALTLTPGAPTPSTETLRPSAAGDETNIKYSAPTSTETLRPNAAGSETAIPSQYPDSGDHYDKVDEVSADDDTTFVYNDPASRRDLYALPAHGGSGDIIKVTVYARVKYSGAVGGYCKTSIRTHSTNYEGSPQAPSSWTTVHTDYATNPNTGNPWTWTEVDALEAGVLLFGVSFCTQVYVTVTYASGAHYTLVDEATADDTDYVNEISGRTARDLYNIANHAVGSGTITKVVTYARGKSVGAGSFKTALKTGGTVYEGDAETSAAYAVKSTEYINNPYTGEAWTWDEVDAVQAGVELVGEAYCSQIYIIVSYTASSTVTNVPFAYFNNKLYVGHGTKLQSLDATGDGFTVVHTMGAVITDLIVSEANMLYILMGATAYEYMDVNESKTASNKTGLIWGVHWDDCLYAIDNTGQLQYSADPSHATPSFTNSGKIETEVAIVSSLFINDDADGNPIIYVGTTRGLFAHDKTNSKLWHTRAQFPEQTHGGKGAATWMRDGAAYCPAGLDVLRYIPGETALIESIGLNNEGGLPVDYRAQIVKFIPGYNEIYALLDSTLSPELSYSSLMAWTGKGWWCPWVAPSTGKRSFSGIVCPAYEYRAWWDWNDKAYYIPIQKDLHNPLKIPNQPFAASSLHITPWFDADAAASDKLAKNVSLQCSGMSANEKVTVKYRIDHAYTDRDTGWTTLGTITSDGETSYDFGSSLGIVFKAIQFRFDLARGGTTTLTPDINWAKLRYRKLLPVMYAWAVTLDCTHTHRDQTAAQLTAALKTIISTQTLVEFTYRDDDGTPQTHYVTTKAMPKGEEFTGTKKQGTYNMLLTEVE